MNPEAFKIKNAVFQLISELTVQNKTQLLSCPYCGAPPYFGFKFLRIKLSEIKVMAQKNIITFVTKNGNDRAIQLRLKCCSLDCRANLESKQIIEVATSDGDVIPIEEICRSIACTLSITGLVNRWNCREGMCDKPFIMNGLD